MHSEWQAAETWEGWLFQDLSLTDINRIGGPKEQVSKVGQRTGEGKPTDFALDWGLEHLLDKEWMDRCSALLFQ